MSISLPAGFKYHAIMSYSWVQKPIVVEIHNFLTANGLKLWRDDRQVTGSVDGSIVEGIQDSKLMLVCMSRDYEQSESAQKELNFAESEKKPLIQIRLDNGPYPKTKFKVGSDDSLYFDFTDLSKKEATMGALFKEIIRTIGVSADQADVDPATAQDVFQNALAGDANAMEIVASNFYFEREFKKAFEWFSRAASLGNLKAEYNLAVMYKLGRGTKQDMSLAINWFTKAANKGHADSQVNLAYIYESGLGGIPVDLRRCAYWREMAAKQGNADAQCALGYMYQEGQGAEQSEEKAVEWYLRSARQGNAVAQNNLGQCYKYGWGVEKDLQRACEWFGKAANTGYVDAMNSLGEIYKTLEDFSRAIKWFQRAANEGNMYAQYNLGTMYENGLGTTKDFKQALEFYTKSAQQGNPSAQYAEGTLYRDGLGVKQDRERARRLFTLAAEGGDEDAQMALEIFDLF